jgi:tetratricopeptide (TPR) repeat protein
MEVHESEQARADLNEAIRLAPINAVYYDNRGLLLRRLGCYADASKDYLRARWIRSGKYRVHNGVVEAMRGDDGSIDDTCTGNAPVNATGATGAAVTTVTTGATGGDSTADATSAPPSDAADSGGGAGSSSDNDTATSSTAATTAASAATAATMGTSAMDNVEEKYAEDNERATSLLRSALRSKPGDRGEAMVQLLADKSDAVAYLRRFPIPVLKEMWR